LAIIIARLFILENPCSRSKSGKRTLQFFRCQEKWQQGNQKNRDAIHCMIAGNSKDASHSKTIYKPNKKD
jgi:hypothetical protein